MPLFRFIHSVIENLLIIFYRFPTTIAIVIVLPTSAIYKPSFNENDVLEFLHRLSFEDLAEHTRYFDRWKTARVNIAVMGNAAVGKSTFVNEIRGAKKGQAGYANVGGGDTTVVPTPYAMPGYENIVFWDTPGLDTPAFQLSESLLESWRVDEFDYILMFYATTFHMSEIKITKMLRDKRKNVAFVRTKIDELLHTDHVLSFEESIQRIKDKGQSILNDYGLGKDVLLFAISNHNRSIGDFNKLVNHILNSLDEIKYESMLLSLENISEKIINEKKTNHLDNVWKACLAVGTVSGIPIPLIDFPVNAGLLMYHINKYLDTFKLDSESLEKLPVEIQSQMKLSATISAIGVLPFLTKEIGMRLATKATEAVAAKVAETVVKYIPFVGPVISGSAGFGMCYSFLESSITDLSNEALVVYNYEMNKKFRKLYQDKNPKVEL